MIATPVVRGENELASFNSHVFLVGCAFLAGLLLAFNIPIVGSLPAGELILGLVTVTGVTTFLLNKQTSNSLFASPWLWAFLATQYITLAGFGIADFYRESTTADIARGWSRIAFLSSDTIAVALLFGEDIRNFRVLMIGCALSGIINAQVNAAEISDDPWKFGYAWPVTIFAILGASNVGVWSTVSVLLVLFGIHYVEDFRSLCGICIINAAFLAILAFEKRQRTIVFSVMAIVAITGLLVMKMHPSSVATSERGARSNVERTSMLTVAWQAFSESPWIGQGSWFSKSDIMAKFQDLRSVMAEEAGVHGYSVDDDDKMAIHSQILVSLAEGGVLGGVFFIFFGACIVWALWYCVLQRQMDRYSAIYSLVLIAAIWELLMSPFTGGHRINIAVAIGVVLLLFQERAQRAAGPEAVAKIIPKDG